MRCTVWTALLMLSLACGTSPSRGSDAPPNVLPAPLATRAAISKLDQARELLQAAQHLRAAGDWNLFRQVHRQAQQLLLKEQARLAAEQELFQELARMSDAQGSDQIVFSIVLTEMPPLPKEELARLWSRFGGETMAATAEGPSDPAFVFPSGVTDTVVLEHLARETSLRIVSRPQVLTQDGSCATISMGQLVADPATSPAAQEDRMVGIHLELTPHLTRDEQVELQLSSERRYLVDSQVRPVSGTSGESTGSPSRIEIATAALQVTLPEDRLVVFPHLVPGGQADADPADGSGAPTPQMLVFLKMQATRMVLKPAQSQPQPE